MAAWHGARLLHAYHVRTSEQGSAVPVGEGLELLTCMPRLSGRPFGLPVRREPTTPIIFFAAGSRDLVVNVGLISAVQHGGNYASRLLTRALSDAGDPRTYGLGAVALVHIAVDVLLSRAARWAGAQGPA